MIEEEDNLLIYYAGHGFFDEPTGVYYWQPVDAKRNDIVRWIATSEITNLLKVIQARHVLVVADSCYSGSLVMRDSGAKLASGMTSDKWLRRMQAKRSRNALTSGGKEPVLDSGGGSHSVFAKAFLEVLRENQVILDGDSLFDRIKGTVVSNAKQTPLYAEIPMTGHDNGDFLLVPEKLQLDGLQSNKKNGLDKELLRGESGKKAEYIKLIEDVDTYLKLLDEGIDKQSNFIEASEKFMKTLQDQGDKSIENDFQFGGK